MVASCGDAAQRERGGQILAERQRSAAALVERHTLLAYGFRPARSVNDW